MIAIAAALTQIGRQNLISRRRLAGILYGISAAVFLRDLRPDRLSWANSLPLHVCDIAGLMAAIAIHTGNRFARCILHYWGLALSSQAFFFPVLNAGPVHTDFWLYWIEHGAIVVAAIYDVAVIGYRPRWSDWRAATLLLACYAMVIAPLDAAFHLNYGYLGQTAEAQRSMIAIFGRWPGRIPALWLTGIALMALLRIRIPFSKSDRNRPSHKFLLRLSSPMELSHRSKAA